MSLYDKAFWAMGLFLVGVLAASAAQGASAALLIISCVTVLGVLLLCILQKQWLAVLCVMVIIGFGYFQWFNGHYQKQFAAPIGEQVQLTGLVEKVVTKDASQSVDLRLRDNYFGLIRLTLRPYPIVQYGDVVKFGGTLESIEGPSVGYFTKEGIGAVMKFPKDTVVIAHHQGSRFKATLYAIRDRVEKSFTQVFTPESATLMTGLVLGKSGGFSKDFSEKLKATGTTHIVALSGYNISIIIKYALAALSLVINRRYGIWLCVAIVIGFVVMTGAEASVVRAAVMATIMIIAEQSGRMYSVRNAILAAAFVMVLFNPNILVFDIGFQLSFLALMGIVYLQPAIEQFFKIDRDPGILGWRKNAVTTTAAQLAVLPIILANFGFFSPLAIMTNILLLSFIPYTMGLGFFIALAALLSPYLAWLIALPAKLLLGYELAVIDFFASLPFGFEMQSLPTVYSLFYYALLVGFIVYVRTHDIHKQSTGASA